MSLEDQPKILKTAYVQLILGDFGGDYLRCAWINPRLQWLIPLVLVAGNVLLTWPFDLWPTLSYEYVVWSAVNAIGLIAVLRLIFGRTVIQRSGGEVLVKRGPLLWPRTFHLFENEIESVELERGFGGKGKEFDSVYRVVIIHKKGRPIWLLKGLHSWASAIRVRDIVRAYLELGE